MNVGQEVVDNKSFRFGLGLPGLPLDVGGSLKVTAGFGYKHLTFGLNGDGTLFFGSPVDELQATVSARFLPNTAITGRLGFLSVTAKDAGTALHLVLGAPVTDTGLGTPSLTGHATASLDFNT